MSTRVSILSAIPFYSFPLLSLIIPSRSLVSEFNPPLYSYRLESEPKVFFFYLSVVTREIVLSLLLGYDIDTREKSMDLEGAYGLPRGGILEFRRVIRDDTLARSVGEVVASRHSAVCFQRDTRLPFDARRRLPHSPPICRLSAQGKPLERENLS